MDSLQDPKQELELYDSKKIVITTFYKEINVNFKSEFNIKYQYNNTLVFLLQIDGEKIEIFIKIPQIKDTITEYDFCVKNNSDFNIDLIIDNRISGTVFKKSKIDRKINYHSPLLSEMS